MMKKRIIPIILLFAAMWMTAVSASAATVFSDGEYYFEKTDGKFATVTDCDLTDEAIEVPGQLFGYPVVGIGKGAFMGKSNIRSVSLPETVSTIGEYAFANNGNLETVSVPRLCKSIADNAFFNSPNVTIRCWYGSAADDYAKENHIPCSYLDNVLVGDTDGDGVLSINDVTAIQLHLSEMRLLEGISLLAADADQNGDIDIADATALQMVLAGFETPYPIGQPIGVQNTSENA